MSDDFDFERYKSIDFSDAKPTRLNPKIRRFQELKREHNRMVLEQFDDDVQQAIANLKAPKDRERLNTILRAFFVTA